MTPAGETALEREVDEAAPKRRERPANRDDAPGLEGVLVALKPPGPTSHDVVALVRRLTGVRRVGHGGTLDPFASGVLPIFIGRATRILEYHTGDEKAYRAVVAFGARSTTDDLDGELTPADAPPPDRATVEAALGEFRGRIRQVPPDYSAVRIAGRKAYELARHGQKPELQPREVEILALELIEWEAPEGERPVAMLEVRCSAGTYVRAIARDLGERLGTGAYLAALTRTASGPFRLEEAHTLDEIREALSSRRASKILLPTDVGLDVYPRLSLTREELDPLLRGQSVRARAAQGIEPGPEGRLRIVDENGRLAAVARLEAGRPLPEKVFATVS